MKNISNLKCSTKCKGKTEPVIGIYIIRGPEAGTGVYVGSSEDCYDRMKDHRSKLKRQVHVNAGFQTFSNEVGLQNLEFIVFKECTPSELIELETEVIEFSKQYVIVFNERKPDCSNSNLTISNRRKRVQGLHLNSNEVITFESTADAGRAGFNQGNVTQACKRIYNPKGIVGGTNIYKGYKWNYIE